MWLKSVQTINVPSGFNPSRLNEGKEPLIHAIVMIYLQHRGSILNFMCNGKCRKCLKTGSLTGLLWNWEEIVPLQEEMAEKRGARRRDGAQWSPTRYSGRQQGCSNGMVEPKIQSTRRWKKHTLICVVEGREGWRDSQVEREKEREVGEI